MGEAPLLEAVYYPHAVPQSRAALTVLALVYDRIHLPGVYLPDQGFTKPDLAPTIKWIAEQEQKQPIAPFEPGWRYLTQYLQLLPDREYLDEFCVFPDAEASRDATVMEADSGPQRISMEPAVGALRLSLESSLFHPRFRSALERQAGLRIPMNPSTVAHELPKGGVIEMTGWGTYSANAMWYSVNRGLPLVNDDPSLPFLATGQIPEESRARMIATTLALRSIWLLMPTIRTLTLAEISSFRRDSRDVIRPFRDSMLTMAADVEALLRDRTDPEKIKKAAMYIAETKVMPQLHELRRFVEQSTKPWAKRVSDAAKEVPGLAAAVMFLPKPVAALVLASRVMAEVADVGAEMLDKERHIDSHGAGYLLRISEDLG